LTFGGKFTSKKYKKQNGETPIKKKDSTGSLSSETSWLFGDLYENRSENEDGLIDFTFIKPLQDNLKKKYIGEPVKKNLMRKIIEEGKEINEEECKHSIES
jgi:hypothetical protein